tara:strand:- start:941 stop:1360 length:420 start_codon:yes stop_codon:yes gene_type:complete
MVLGRSSFFIIILTVIITSISPLKANDDPVGLGVGTRTCSNFIIETVEIGDDGDLTERALKRRLVYLQWANGFMTALNIRYFEKNNEFKNLNTVVNHNDFYNQILSSCNYIIDEGDYNDFSIATFVLFDNIPQEENKED